ncbi:hypothetical protein PINS_up022514 [Pythium insidiosum]|nr:hypothetical protein PINS_up022514 [Pythium insidiosum]
MQSLAGHQSPVECLVFDPTERKVVRGSKAGSIKAFDLEAGKVSPHSQGPHVDVHDGGLPPLRRLCRIRRARYDRQGLGPAHQELHADLQGPQERGPPRVCFTPDGRWLTSGSMDGSIRIWTSLLAHASRVSRHGGAITALEFNPEEFHTRVVVG